MPNIMTLLLHAGTIAAALKSIETTIANCIKEKRAPNSDDDKALIAAAESLLAAGIITIPGLDMSAVTKGLEDVKAVL